MSEHNKLGEHDVVAQHAYAAGFFDGEGYFVATSTPSQAHWRAGVANTHLPTVEWFKHHYGGSIHKHRRYPSTTKGFTSTKDVFEWVVVGHGAYAFLTLILPYLQYKQEHAQFMMKMWDIRKDTVRYKALCEERKERWGQKRAAKTI